MSRSKSTKTYILLPVNRLWMYASLFIALLINISPLGDSRWSPDVVAVAVAFWSYREPRVFNLLAPFIMGLLMDIHNGAVLGQHALAYIFICYGTLLLQRRLPWFSLIGQALHLLPIFFLSQGLVLLVRLVLGGVFPGWDWFIQSFANAILWPLWSFVMLLPQMHNQRKDSSHSL